MTARKVKVPKHNFSWMGDLMFSSLQHQTPPIHLNHNPPYRYAHLQKILFCKQVNLGNDGTGNNLKMASVKMTRVEE